MLNTRMTVAGTTGGGGAASGATQSSLRTHNLALVARHIVDSTHPVSRADIAAATGMTRSTVSRLVDELVRARLVSEQAPSGGGQRGRPAVPLVPAAGTLVCLGLEANVRHLAVSVVDLAGNEVASRYREGSYAGQPPAVVLGELAQLAQACLAETPYVARRVGVQLAVPGLVDATSGYLLRAPNLGWQSFDPAQVLKAAGLDDVSLGFGLGNEADYAALTVLERLPGQLGELDTFLYLSGEVGIGSSAVSRGLVMTGRRGWAGEIGHVCVDPRGERCACGAIGCLETVAGRDALLRRAGYDDLNELLAALNAGVPAAMQAVESAGNGLGVAISDALNLLDLSNVVLGGHLAALGPVIIPMIEAELGHRVLSWPYGRVAVRVAKLDLAPAALGAAYAGLDQVLADPARWVDG